MDLNTVSISHTCSGPEQLRQPLLCSVILSPTRNSPIIALPVPDHLGAVPSRTNTATLNQQGDKLSCIKHSQHFNNAAFD